jgi:hypothetical protein
MTKLKMNGIPEAILLTGKYQYVAFLSDGFRLIVNVAALVND